MDGPTGRFTYSAMTSMRLQNRQEVTFHGDKGLLKVANGPFNANLFAEARIEVHKDQTITSERWPAANHYKLQVEAFGHSIRTGAPYACPLAAWPSAPKRATNSWFRRLSIQVSQWRTNSLS